MNKLLRELLYVPKYGKVKEKALLGRITGSVTVIVLCLAAMSFTAYAYFASSVTSGMSVIKSATFALDTTINGSAAVENEDGYYELSAGSNLLKLQESEQSNASTGYGKIEIFKKDASGEYEELLTCYTPAFVHGENSTVSVTFVVPEGAAFYAKVVSEWGTSAMPSMLGNGETEEPVTIDLADFVDVPGYMDPGESGPGAMEPEDEEPDVTDPEETDPEVTDPEATDPKETEPEDKEPEATDPKETEPEDKEPEATDPVETEPEDEEPEATDPEATEPEATDPEVTEPEDEEPEATDPEYTVEQYVVQAGDTLYDIASKYHTTYEILQAYNGIENPRLIYEGQVILIPPEDYVVPETTEPEQTEPAATEPLETESEETE